LGILLNAAYFLWAYQRMFFGKLNEKYADLPDISRLELFTVVPLALITLFFGVYPAPFLNVIRETVNSLIEQVVTIGGTTGIF
ncbi:MAG: NADH-quinone oxidoreductase subunit M, partial [Candidatus Marinimicrobia bacterium]|nr:NADH-quinone oxidoreductase subunit M [Candidatus Neomarinimicrobiota bacterium]